MEDAEEEEETLTEDEVVEVVEVEEEMVVKSGITTHTNTQLD